MVLAVNLGMTAWWLRHPRALPYRILYWLHASQWDLQGYWLWRSFLILPHLTCPILSLLTCLRSLRLAPDSRYWYDNILISHCQWLVSLPGQYFSNSTDSTDLLFMVHLIQYITLWSSICRFQCKWNSTLVNQITWEGFHWGRTSAIPGR